MKLPTRWIKVLKDVWGNKTRSALVVLSIAVGVFAVGMTTHARIIIERDLNTAYRAVNPASATLIVSPSFGEDFAHAVEAMREVETAEARRLETVEVFDGEAWREVTLTAAPDFDAVRVNRFSIEQGAGAPGLREILLERETAAMLGAAVGDTLAVRLDEDGQAHDLTVTGVVHDLTAMPPQYFDQGTGYVSVDTLRWMGAGGGYNALAVVVAEPGADKDRIREIARLARERIAEPASYYVSSIRLPEGDPGTHWASQMISGVLIILMAIGAMCLLLGAGLVVNTISALIAQQVRQIGIIRAVGGLRRQILVMYLAGVLLYSLCALALAIPLARIGAEAMAGAVADQVNFDVTAAGLPPTVVALQVMVGLIVPLAAALGPVMTGTNISIRQAIYEHGNITAVNKGVIEALLKRLKGLSSATVLAVRNTFRRKARLIFTLATLVLAGATFMAAFSTHRTLSQQITSGGRYWLYDAAIDIPGGANEHTALREARRVEGVVVAEGWYRIDATPEIPGVSEPEAVEVMAIPPGAATVAPRIVSGRWLRAGDTEAIVVNEDLTDDLPDLDVGDAITLVVDGPNGETRSRHVVVGIASRHMLGTRIYAPYEAFTKTHELAGQVNLVRVRASERASVDALLPPAAQDALAARLADRFEEAGLGRGETDTYHEAITSNSGNFDILLTVLLLMSALLAVVGGLGLAGTMSLNVLERTREIGVLRAVGASNASVRRIVVFEGMVVGMLSWLLSAALAVPFGYGLASAVSLAVLDAPADFRFSGPGVGLWLALIVAIAAAASLAPAQRAAQLTVREVLAYE
jgi:putative ABC transport system permease protein